MNLNRLYKNRFSEQEDRKKQDVWDAVCRSYLRRYVHADDTVLDIAAGGCEFINAITTAENADKHPANRIAVDCNPAVMDCAADGVTAYCQDISDLSNIPAGSVNVIFISNFFEHIPKEKILELLIQCDGLLAANGRLLILQPNFRFAYRNYWDFFDHITPITDRSLAEAIHLSGEHFIIEKLIPQFLPYTTKSRLPQAPWLIRLYLRMPLAWSIFGKQIFCVVRKDANKCSAS